MQKRTAALLIICCAITVCTLAASGVFRAPAGVTAAPDQITVGQPPLEQSALIYVAEERGFFAKNGLNVTIRDTYPNGVQPVQDLLNNDIDLAVSAEYPVLAAITRGGNITIIAVIDQYQNEKLIGHRDRQIFNESDLNKKKIGYPEGTIVEFFLDRFLTLHGVGPGNVTLVSLNVSEAAGALADGRVDAVAYYQPHVAAIEAGLGENASVWPLQSHQHLYGVLSARSEWVASNPGTVRRFLMALAEAEAYSAGDPAGFRQIVEKRLNLSNAYATAIWPAHQFTLSLDQSLVLAMEDEARWMIRTNRSITKELPSVLDHLDVTSLYAVKPGSVNIIRKR